MLIEYLAMIIIFRNKPFPYFTFSFTSLVNWKINFLSKIFEISSIELSTTHVPMTFSRFLAGCLEVRVTQKSSQDIPQINLGVEISMKKGLTFCWSSTVKVTISVQSFGGMLKGVAINWMPTIIFLLVSYLIIDFWLEISCSNSLVLHWFLIGYT